MSYRFDLRDEVGLPTAEDDAELCRLSTMKIEKLTPEQIARLDAWVEARRAPIRDIHDRFPQQNVSYEERYASLGWEQNTPATHRLMATKPIHEVIRILKDRGFVPNNIAEITGTSRDLVCRVLSSDQQEADYESRSRG